MSKRYVIFIYKILIFLKFVFEKADRFYGDILMQINNELLSYTLKKNVTVSAETVVPVATQLDNTPLISDVSEIDTLSINGEVIEASGVMTDEEYAKAVSSLKNETSEKTEMKTFLTLDDIQSDEYKLMISGIKNAIFNYNHSGGWIQPTEDTSTYTFLNHETTTGENGTQTTTIAFKGTNELVSWLKGTNNWDDEKGGLPHANLVKLTQNDDLEDANRDFFGQLNRAFYKGLNSDNNYVISYDELVNFFNEIKSMDQIQEKVQKYSEELQKEYDNLSLQGKLEFAIDKTREYLEAMGMQSQIDALDRLLKIEDKFNDCHVGNIAIADLNEDCNVATDGMTLGAYNYMAYFGKYGGKYNNSYDIKTWAGDSDLNVDLGITLDRRLVDKNYDENAKDSNLGHWYDIVNTLVHELTHAAAYQYYSRDEDGTITKEGVEQLIKIGAVESEAAWNQMTLERQEYLAYTAWGEYYAYQADADYVDSIAGDVLDPQISTAGDGKYEKDIIDNHIKSEYNSDSYFEAIPDWKWWTYA